MVARILPQFLDDFFPPQDVMNKVIGEFLSNQQPYPQFMATVVYKVWGWGGGGEAPGGCLTPTSWAVPLPVALPWAASSPLNSCVSLSPGCLCP